MKKIKNSIFGLIIAAACLPGSNASAVGSDPSIAKVTVFGIAVSKNQDCSGAVVVGYNPVGTVYDFLQKPSIVSGDIAAGTYQCVILYMNNLLTFTPLTSETGNAPGCVAATSYSRIICAASGCTFTKTSVDASNNLTYTGNWNSAVGEFASDIDAREGPIVPQYRINRNWQQCFHAADWSNCIRDLYKRNSFRRALRRQCDWWCRNVCRQLQRTGEVTG
jgi:hypothetical protein